MNTTFLIHFFYVYVLGAAYAYFITGIVIYRAGDKATTTIAPHSVKQIQAAAALFSWVSLITLGLACLADFLDNKTRRWQK